MLHIVGAAVVREWCGSAMAQFSVTHKQVDLPTRFLMIDDASALAGLRCGGILALPVKSLFVDPVVQVLVIFRFTLFVQGDEQHVSFLIV